MSTRTRTRIVLLRVRENCDHLRTSSCEGGPKKGVNKCVDGHIDDQEASCSGKRGGRGGTRHNDGEEGPGQGGGVLEGGVVDDHVDQEEADQVEGGQQVQGRQERRHLYKESFKNDIAFFLSTWSE